VSFISDGVLSMAVQGTTLGLLGEEKETDGVSGAEVRVCARVALGTKRPSQQPTGVISKHPKTTGEGGLCVSKQRGFSVPPRLRWLLDGRELRLGCARCG
jgi:hypothetical protein